MSDRVSQEHNVSSSGEDWIRAEREHERVMAGYEAESREADRRHKRLLAEERTERIQTVVVVLAIAGVILGIAYLVWIGINQGAERSARLELACIENGGSWTSLGSSSAKSCYYIGSIEEGTQQ